MNYLVLDASVWVSRLVPQDTFHEAVKEWMAEQRANGTEFVSPSLLLVEVGGAVSRRTGIPSLGEKAVIELERLPALRLVEMDNFLMREAALLAAELGLRGADAVYVATASHLELPLVTFDVDQGARATTRVEVRSILSC